MKVKTPEKGMIVESVQGRDKGCFYVITEILKDGFISVADGKKRTLSSPKKKNVKHVRLTAGNIADSGITTPWDKAFDNRVAYLLKSLKDGQADKS